jgi:hypothetical protein
MVGQSSILDSGFWQHCRAGFNEHGCLLLQGGEMVMGNEAGLRSRHFQAQVVSDLLFTMQINAHLMSFGFFCG